MSIGDPSAEWPSYFEEEVRVARFLNRHQYLILAHNVRILKVQVDLLVRDPEKILTLIEVKSGPMAFERGLMRSQKSRLMRVANFLSQFEKVQIQLALVNKEAIDLMEVDGLTPG